MCDLYEGHFVEYFCKSRHIFEECLSEVRFMEVAKTKRESEYFSIFWPNL